MYMYCHTVVSKEGRRKNTDPQHFLEVILRPNQIGGTKSHDCVPSGNLIGSWLDYL